MLFKNFFCSDSVRFRNVRVDEAVFFCHDGQYIVILDSVDFMFMEFANLPYKIMN